MKIGLRAILLLAAVLLFVVAIFADAKTNWLCAGLACFAGAFLLSDLAGSGLGGRLRRM